MTKNNDNKQNQDLINYILLDEKAFKLLEQHQNEGFNIVPLGSYVSELEQTDREMGLIPGLDIEVHSLKSLRFDNANCTSFNIGYSGANRFELPFCKGEEPKDMRAPLIFPVCPIKVKCDFDSENSAQLDSAQARNQVFFKGSALATCVKEQAQLVSFNFSLKDFQDIDGGTWYDFTGWQELSEYIDEIIEQAAFEFGGTWFTLAQLAFIANSLKVSYFEELAYMLTVSEVVKF